MWSRSIAWSSLAAAMLLLNQHYVLAQTDDDPYNINLFNELRLNNPSALCKYLQCLPPVKSCPEGTLWMDNVAMYGCCGGCIRFKEKKERDCTGSIDPLYGDGYCDIVDGEVACPTRPISRKAENSFDFSFNASLRASDTNDNIIQSSWCGYGLQCFGGRPGQPTQCTDPVISGNTDSRTCVQARTALKAFMDIGYDELRDDYLWIPECTLEGLYQPKQCKGPADNQRCVCVDPYGHSLYGAAFPEQEELFDTMNCECSRRVWDQQKNGIDSPTLHCLENGNYEPIQCENGYCYCIDPNTTDTYGPTVPEKAMFILPCYNKTLLGDNNKYLRLCDSKHHAHISLRNFMITKGYSEAPLSKISCDPDGSFSGLQRDGTKVWCANKFGDKYPIADTSEESGCNCKRDEELFESLNPNKEIVCRGGHGGYYTYHSDENGAYCVDEHGIRAGPKVKPKYCQLLQCQASMNCQIGMTGADGQTDMCSISCVNGPGTCPPCVYTSYQGEDMAECDKIPDLDNTECTDVNHGN